MLRGLIIGVSALVMIGCGGYLYASSGIKAKPGYVKLQLPNPKFAEPLISVKLGPGGVGPMRWLFKQITSQLDGESDLAQQVISSVLHELHGVQLQVYEVDNNQAVFEQAINRSILDLKKQNWSVLLRVQERDEHVVVMQSASDDLISGFSVLVSNADNAIFLNLIGPFDPALITERNFQNL